MEEIWRPVKDFEGYYEVSNLGRVRSIDRVVVDTVRNCERLLKGKILIQRDNGSGYKGVQFCKEHPELFKTEEKVKVEKKKLTEEDKKAYQREYHKLHYEEHKIWMKERGNKLRRKRRSENREEENRKQREYRRVKKLKKS